MQTTLTPCLILLSASISLAQPALKVYISADMEGLTGVVTGEQLSPNGFEYGRFRKIMTQEVNAAIAGARAAGASQILVSDSHGNGQNLLLEELPPDIQLVRAWPRPLGMMQGIDESFDAAVFIGYHAGATNPKGIRAHTMSSATLADIRINGISMPEAGINAAIAGHFDVPVVMISGDDAIVQEASSLLGNLESVIVKWAGGFHSARTLMPAATLPLIEEKVEAALRRRADFRPYKIELPARLEVRFKNYQPSEILSYLPNVERIDSHSIRFMARDALEVSRFLQFLGKYQAGLAP